MYVKQFELIKNISVNQELISINPELKGLCHGSPVQFVWFCQLLALNRYGT